jgi:inhibitor of cysteine peptidase
MIRTAVFLAVSLVLVTSAQTADNPKEGPAALERKLHGEWIGGPCIGELTLGADGSFKRRNYSPGGHDLTGTWELQWNAIPPTLVLTCKTSDNPDYVGKTSKFKLIQLDDGALAYQYAGTEDKNVYRFTRVKKADNPKEDPAALERKLHGTWNGPPCTGKLTLGADGSFERRNYSPGNHNLTGTWEVRWNALPPTLVLTCKTSDYPDFVGKTSEVKLIQVDDEVLALGDRYEDRYQRVKKK